MILVNVQDTPNPTRSVISNNSKMLDFTTTKTDSNHSVENIYTYTKDQDSKYGGGKSNVLMFNFGQVSIYNGTEAIKLI